jgi:hypothetical protein
MKKDIQFWRSGEWTMVYVNGELERAGDHYLADEWLQIEVGVKVVDDEAGVCLPGGHPLSTLAEVHKAMDAREQRAEVAAAYRAEAEILIAKAAELEAQK